MHETERPEDAARRMARKVAAVQRLHDRRIFPLDGYPGDYGQCVECRQSWPCATIRAMEDVDGE